TIKTVRKHMEKYEFNVVGTELYTFIWNDFCDWYIELSKINMNDTTKTVLLHTLTSIIKMLHPMMPYVTDEIYSMIPFKDAENIMISSYPVVDKNIFKDTGLDEIIELIQKIRKLKVDNKMGRDFIIEHNNNETILNCQDILAKMTKCENIVENAKTTFTKIEVNFNDSIIGIYYDGTMSESDIENMKKEIQKLESSIERRTKLLSNENYTKKAPANVVLSDRETLEKEKNDLSLLLEKIK
ncbi:MAG: class I tRNA ligase family protein, partial [Bacilli bacterium]